MLKIKNKVNHPVQISLRSRDHRSIETITLGARQEIMVEEDDSTAMIDNLKSRGLLRVSRVV